MEIRSLLLWDPVYPSFRILLHSNSRPRSDIWLCHRKITTLSRFAHLILIYLPLKLWCWVSIKWDFLRIATFYGPVWLIISLTFAIYLRAGTVIYQKRRQLQNLGGVDSMDPESPESPFATLTGIHVTREIACSTPERRSLSAEGAHGLPSAAFRSYTVTIEGGCKVKALQGSNDQIGGGTSQRETSGKARLDGTDSQRRASTDAVSATWAYTKYAMLFFIALLVTWVSTCNVLSRT